MEVKALECSKNAAAAASPDDPPETDSPAERTSVFRRISGFFYSPASVPMLDVPSKLGLPTLPIRTKTELSLRNYNDCVKTLNQINRTREGLLFSLRAILTNNDNEKLKVCKSEISKAMKQADELTDLSKFCHDQYRELLPAEDGARSEEEYLHERVHSVELDQLEATIIADLKVKIPAYSRVGAIVNTYVETTLDKISTYAKKHPIGTLFAAAPITMYAFLGCGAMASVFVPAVVGATCTAAKFKETTGAFKDIAPVAKSMLSDAADSALPIGILFAAAYACNGNTAYAKTFICAGAAINAVSALYNNSGRIRKGAVNYARSTANRVLSFAKDWFRAGYGLRPLLATGVLAGFASSACGQKLSSNLYWGIGAAGLQLATSGLVNLSEARSE